MYSCCDYTRHRQRDYCGDPERSMATRPEEGAAERAGEVDRTEDSGPADRDVDVPALESDRSVQGLASVEALPRSWRARQNQTMTEPQGIDECGRCPCMIQAA